MNTIEIPEIEFKKEIPEKLEEFTPKQFAFLGKLLYKLHQDEINISDLKTMLLYKLLGIGHDKKAYSKLSDDAKFNIAENIFRISELYDFLFVQDFIENKPILRFNSSFIHNPIPEIPAKPHRGILMKYYGPAEALQDVTFGQYIDGLHHFERFSQTNDPDSLDKLVAVLYLPKCRKYHNDRVEKRAKILSRLDIGYRFAVYLFFFACVQFLREGEVTFEGQKISLKFLYEETIKEKKLQEKVKYKFKSGLTGIVFSLAQTGIFGPADKVAEQNLYDILFLLYLQRTEYLNQLEQYETK